MKSLFIMSILFVSTPSHAGSVGLAKSMIVGDFSKTYEGVHKFPAAWSNLCMGYRRALIGEGVVPEVWFGIGATEQVDQTEVVRKQCEAWVIGMKVIYPTSQRWCHCK